MSIDVNAWNEEFSQYPMTVEDKGWIYGVWYCGTAWQRSTLYGQYPPKFKERALALFPDARDILHCPSGTVDGPGITLDMFSDESRVPQVVGDCGALPFADECFDLVLSDPPYSEKDSAVYGAKKFPMGRFMREAHRALRPGGYLGVLHTYYPSYRRKEYRLVALIAVVTGFCRATRMFSVFERQ